MSPWPRVFALVSLAATATASAATQVVDAHARYPESPVWYGGRLYYVEYAADDIKRWDGHSASVYWRHAHCGPSGLIELGAHHLLVACYDANALVELDENGTEVRTLATDQSGAAFEGPNDFAADGNGGVYFSASGKYDTAAPITGAVLHLSKDGIITALADTIHYANGLTLSHDGRRLLVAEMFAGRILEFPILPDGRLGPRRVWARLQDIVSPTPDADAYDGPDGLKAGSDGAYYIAQNGSGRVLVVDEQRKLRRQIRVPTRYVTNIVFGPEGSGILYIAGVFDQWKEPYAGTVYRWSR